MGASLADIPAFILAGGFGTRLRSVVGELPKILAPIHGRPFLHYLLEQLASAGLRDVTLCTGYRADLVEETLGTSFGPMALRYQRETTPLGTGGALRAACAGRGTILAVNGDSYCGFDAAAFLAAHELQAATISLVLTHVDDTGRFGQVRLDDAQRVLEFAEKRPGAGAGWINAGIYLLSSTIFPAGDGPLSLEREVFPAWVGRGLYGFPEGRDFIDIGTPESYAAAERFFTK